MANALNRIDDFDPMDAFFGNFGKSFLTSVAGNQMKTDVVENDDRYELKAELPGFKKNDIHIDYSDDTLTIRAVHDLKKETKESDGNVIRRERSSSNVNRSFYLPDVDDAKVAASYDGGILKVTLPKQAPAKENPTHIDIQ